MVDVQRLWYWCSGKLMGYAALGNPSESLKDAVRQDLTGCPVLSVMERLEKGGEQSTPGKKSPSSYVESCIEEYGTGFGAGGKPFLNTVGIAAAETAGVGAAGVGAAPLNRSGSGTVFVASTKKVLVSRQQQRDIAASAQAVMEEDIVAMISDLLAMHGGIDRNRDGSGGGGGGSGEKKKKKKKKEEEGEKETDKLA